MAAGAGMYPGAMGQAAIDPFQKELEQIESLQWKDTPENITRAFKMAARKYLENTSSFLWFHKGKHQAFAQDVLTREEITFTDVYKELGREQSLSVEKSVPELEFEKTFMQVINRVNYYRRTPKSQQEIELMPMRSMRQYGEKKTPPITALGRLHSF